MYLFFDRNVRTQTTLLRCGFSKTRVFDWAMDGRYPTGNLGGEQMKKGACDERGKFRLKV